MIEYKKMHAYLESKGRLKLLPKIAQELRRREARTKLSASRVEVANEKDSKVAIREAKQFGIDADCATINPSLIRGWRAQTGAQLVDRSAKQALVEIYKNITR